MTLTSNLRADGNVHGDVTPDQLKAVLRHHAKGVAVITAGTDAPTGFCATSLTSVSLVPPVLLFAIRLGSSSWEVISTAPHVMVHLLAHDQQDLARRFGRPGEARFDPETRWHRGPFGLPTLDGVLAWLALAPTHRLTIGDHALILGHVVQTRNCAAGNPLVHHNRKFARLTPD
jgi:flavin reductase (DIM6/NTAB) family NADH-FMN oxidoreductase RutF